MIKNWLINECKKADSSKDTVILENPEKKNYLDNLMINRFWPVIRLKLKGTNYNFEPKENPETDYELSHELTRSLTFMLFDDGKAFYKGKLNCSTNIWMLESEFFLGLAKENDLLVILDILKNSRFRGFPPTLNIYTNYKEYFLITFHNGEGKSWAVWSDKQIDDRIAEIIDINIQLYEFSKDGYIAEEKTGGFISLAYQVYEAY